MPDGGFGPLDEVLHRRHASGVDVLVVAGDLLDHAHQRGLVAVARQVPMVRPPDALPGRTLARVGVVVLLGRRREPLLLGAGDLAEDLLLRVEVVVEGPGRQAGGVRDVGDPRLEVPVPLEHELGRIHETRPGLQPLA